jgi:hypothetical protein
MISLGGSKKTSTNSVTTNLTAQRDGGSGILRPGVLDFGQEIPDHSTFSKNRHGRFRESGVFREVFEAELVADHDDVQKLANVRPS